MCSEELTFTIYVDRPLKDNKSIVLQIGEGTRYFCATKHTLCR